MAFINESWYRRDLGIGLGAPSRSAGLIWISTSCCIEAPMASRTRSPMPARIGSRRLSQSGTVHGNSIQCLYHGLHAETYQCAG